MNKYHVADKSRRTLDNILFDSLAERNRYIQLKQLIHDGKIKNLKVHPTYLLQDSIVVNGERIRGMKYEGDFSYIENGKQICEDVKGFETQVFKLKYKLFVFRYPDIEFRKIKV